MNTTEKAREILRLAEKWSTAHGGEREKRLREYDRENRHLSPDLAEAHLDLLRKNEENPDDLDIKTLLEVAVPVLRDWGTEEKLQELPNEFFVMLQAVSEVAVERGMDVPDIRHARWN